MQRVRRKDGWRRRLAAAFLAAAALCAGGCEKQAAAGAAETELEKGQRRIEIQVVSITGNELTYVERETESATEAESEDGERTGDVSTEETSGKAQSENTERMGDGPPDMPGEAQSGNEGGDMPNMSRPGGNMPDGSQLSAGGEGPLATGIESETTTVYLSVAVLVHTDGGRDRTFTILEAGDILEVLFETNEAGDEIITEIWLTGTED